MRRTGLLSVLPCLVLLACDGSEDPPGNVDKPVEMNDAPVEIDINPDEYPTFRFSDLALPYESKETCLKGGKPWKIRDCVCEHCLNSMQECDVLPGCQEIVECSLNSGCTDSFTCYLSPIAPCTQIIDRWGNASVATTVSLELMDCVNANACR